MRSFWILLCALVVVAGLPACESNGNGGYRVTVESPPSHPHGWSNDSRDRRGPPPHAPAHGYRHKHHDHGHDYDLVYDSGVRCYSVAGYRDVYYNDGAYFRFGKDGWQVSASFGDDARWDYCPESRLPGGLKVKYKDKGHDGKGEGKGKGQGKGKNKQKYSSADHWGKYGS